MQWYYFILYINVNIILCVNVVHFMLTLHIYSLCLCAFLFSMLWILLLLFFYANVTFYISCTNIEKWVSGFRNVTVWLSNMDWNGSRLFFCPAWIFIRNKNWWYFLFFGGILFTKQQTQQARTMRGDTGIAVFIIADNNRTHFHQSSCWFTG